MGVALTRPEPGQHLRGMIHPAEVLLGIGVTIEYIELAADILGDWNDYTRTASVREDAHPLNQAWFLWQVLTFLLSGPAATPAARHERRLTLVPSLPSDH
jgi:hypothetical protein